MKINDKFKSQPLAINIFCCRWISLGLAWLIYFQYSLSCHHGICFILFYFLSPQVQKCSEAKILADKHYSNYSFHKAIKWQIQITIDILYWGVYLNFVLKHTFYHIFRYTIIHVLFVSTKWCMRAYSFITMSVPDTRNYHGIYCLKLTSVIKKLKLWVNIFKGGLNNYFNSCWKTVKVLV